MQITIQLKNQKYWVLLKTTSNGDKFYIKEQLPGLFLESNCQYTKWQDRCYESLYEAIKTFNSYIEAL